MRQLLYHQQLTRPEKKLATLLQGHTLRDIKYRSKIKTGVLGKSHKKYKGKI